jgi:hypothetical protein
MSAGIVQLVSIGSQDAFLTGDPQVSFFQSMYKRHTNFSMFRKLQVISGTPSAGGISTIRFERLGDLLSYVYLQVSTGGTSQLVTNWSDVIDYCELLIGGQVIDKQDVKFTEEIAIDTLAQNYSKSFPASLHGGLGSQSFFYPLRFFFCENWQSVLPLIALSYHDIEVRIRWSSSLNTNYTVHAFASFASLDTDERAAFTNGGDMLIYQVQVSTPSSEKIQEITLNHPVKFLASSNATTNSLVSRTNTIKLEVNGVDITDQSISVPNYTAVPSYYHTDFSSANSENMFLYPFCLSVSKLQPTGTLNFSRIDTFKIHCSEAITQPIYAVNYNILKIKNGMGGLLYAN